MAAHPIKAKYLEPLYPAVGELIVNWSILDSQIVNVVAAISRTAGGKHVAKKMKTPFGFARRARFLRLCVRRVDALSPYLDDIERILSEAEEIFELRNAVVQSAVTSYDPQSKLYSFENLDIDQSGKVSKAHCLNTTLSKIETAQMGAKHLTVLATILVLRMFEEFPNS